MFALLKIYNMKKIILGLSAISMIAFTSCEKKEATAVEDAQEVAMAADGAHSFNVNTETSEVSWRGYKFYEAENKEGGHEGFIKLKEGSLKAEDGVITEGSFVIDAATLESTDLNDSPEDKAKLDGHLKNPDFLDVEKYPTPTFNITNVAATEEGSDFNTEISGNLKFRDIEKNITFKANVNFEGHGLSLESEEFTINRQDFGITFKGGGGAVIKDNIDLKVTLNATMNHEVEAEGEEAEHAH